MALNILVYAALFDTASRPFRVVRAEYEIGKPIPGIAEIDPEIY